jgi:hypothetical protein
MIQHTGRVQLIGSGFFAGDQSSGAQRAWASTPRASTNRGALAAKLPKWGWLRCYIAAQNWETNIREVKHDAPLHPTVVARAGLARVPQCATVGPYRPAALHHHDVFKPHPLDPGAESSPEIHGSPPLQSGTTTPGTSGS